MGVDRDPKKAFEWYEKSANQQNRRGLRNLGRLYEDENKISEAINCYIQSGDSDLCSQLFKLKCDHFMEILLLNEKENKNLKKELEKLNGVIQNLKDQVENLKVQARSSSENSSKSNQ